MASLVLSIKYNKNTGLVLSASELLENYLTGIPLCTTDGKTISKATIQQHIEAAQKRIENLFSIKLSKEVIFESRDFIREEFNSWGHVRAMYPVSFIGRLWGYINQAVQISYPHEWLQIKRLTSVAVYRNIQLIPNSGSPEGARMTQNSIIYNGISPHLGWFGQQYIPNYWRVLYVTGWDTPPADLLDLIAKYAAMNVLAIIGDYLYGVGIGSISISLDGVSQSIPLTKNGPYGLFSGRLKLYMDDINNQMPALRNQYRGITFEVL